MTTPRDPSTPPGESEFSWGPNLMPDPEREPPHLDDQRRATFRTNLHSDDPEYQENYDGDWEA